MNTINLNDKINSFPELPGVYFMWDKNNNLIYIGKSVNLKIRVRQYFTPSGRRSDKISQMIDLIKDVTIEITDTELDALLLECSLIKEKQPYFNSLLKNHKKYSYVKIDSSEYPTLKAVNEIKEDDSMYLGPFGSQRKLEDILSKIRAFFQLRNCPTSLPLSGCINKDLGNCLGPCKNKSEENKTLYKNNLNLALEFVKGNDNLLNPYIKEKMLLFSQTLDFEKALKAKELLELLNVFKGKQQVLGIITFSSQIVALHKLDEGYKLYIFLGGVLIYSQILYLDFELAKLEAKNIASIKFTDYLPETLAFQDKKALIDQASIIYYYLSTSNKINVL